jgi:PAS domain S-box-containing protein
VHIPSADALFRALERARIFGLAAVDAEGRQTYVSEGFCELFGFAAQELLGRTPPFAYWPPEEVSRIQAALESTMRGEAPRAGFDLRFAHKDGRRLGVRVLIVPIPGSGGHPAGWLATVTDVGEQKETEARLRRSERLLAEAQQIAHLGSWEWEVGASTVWWSDEMYRVYGLEPGSVQITYDAYKSRIHPDDREAMARVVQHTIETGEPFIKEHRAVLPDGTVRYLLARGGVMRDAQGRVVRLAGTGQDVTELRQMEEERQKLARERAAHEHAAALSRAKDEFLAMLGHELRNPLAPIVTALKLMELRGGDVLRKEREVVERQVRHMIRLVDDLLDVSRIARGKVQLRRSALDVADILARALEIASPLFEERGHALNLDVPRGVSVYGDEQRLTQVFANILTNAAKYTPPGGHVHVSARQQETGVEVRIRDDGVGIEPGLLPHVFDLFVQGRRGPDRSQGGLGLGLAIVRSLVRLHGGEVEALSNGPGTGAEFVVRLPVRAERRSRPPAPTDPTPQRQPGGARRVLVVDDNGDAAEMLAGYLRSAGHEVHVASDGVSALDLAVRVRPEVALLDIGLPVMDGYELARRLQEIEDLAGLRLVAITGYGQHSDRARSAQSGFEAHFVKPIEPAEVEALISNGSP